MSDYNTTNISNGGTYSPIINTETTNPQSSESVLSRSNDNWEISFEELRTDRELGRGAFGVVFHGTWRNQEVAVKQIPSNLNQKEFLAEVNLMRKLRPHDNVVQLLGVCTHPQLLIVTRFYSNGSLLNFIENQQSSLDRQLLLKVLCGITAGMEHLHQEKIIHRDLAARNCLLTASFDAVVADFGLSRILSTNDSGRTNANVGPVKWMAPESLTSRVYSPKSDVYSFGVVCYECMTLEPPWKDKDNLEVVVLVVGGQRLHIPAESQKKYPLKLTELAELCLEEDPSKRPTFQDLFRQLSDDESMGK